MDLPVSLMETEVSWELCKEVSPFSSPLLILERMGMPSPRWRLGVSQLELFAGLAACCGLEVVCVEASITPKLVRLGSSVTHAFFTVFAYCK